MITIAFVKSANLMAHQTTLNRLVSSLLKIKKENLPDLSQRQKDPQEVHHEDHLIQEILKSKKKMQIKRKRGKKKNLKCVLGNDI